MWQVAWAHPMYGNILASCSYDRKVIIWKEENGTWEKTYEYTGHDSSGMGVLLVILQPLCDVSLLLQASYAAFTSGVCRYKIVVSHELVACDKVAWKVKTPCVLP